MKWRAGSLTLEVAERPLLMGIVNVTPDSFSDGGQFYEAEKAIEHGLQLAAEGADILDIGGESTRPGAAEVPSEEEMRRVLPVISGLKRRTGVPLSIDTQKPAVALQALAAGPSIVNDIAASRNQSAMWQIVARYSAGYVLMHMKGTPQTMQAQAQYSDVVAEVNAFFRDRLKAVESAGVNPEQIVLDPGIGFGKTTEHNLQLLASLDQFTIHQRPVLLGASRKSFIGKLLDAEMEQRLPGSIACAIWAALKGIRIIRVHDVRATRQALRMIEEICARRR